MLLKNYFCQKLWDDLVWNDVDCFASPQRWVREREDYFIRDESVLRIKNSEAVTPERRIISAK